MCRGETVERDKNNLYGSISEAGGENHTFALRHSVKTKKAGCYGSNRR